MDPSLLILMLEYVYLMAGTASAAGWEHTRRYRATGQCGFAFMLQVGLFTDPDEYGREMDALATRLRELAPLEGFEQASYAGGIEGERELEFREHGIPVGPEHRHDLEDIAAEFGVDVPWAGGG